MQVRQAQSALRIPERDQLLKDVEEIGDVIMANADEAEKLRRLPQDSVDALERAGIFRMLLPRELGGYEADPVTQHEVIDRLSYFDASTGWCGFIGAGSSAFAAGNLPADGLQEIQATLAGGAQWTRFAGSPIPAGRATPVEGGYRVSGRWPWGSGIHHARWVFAGAAILNDGEIEMTSFGLPKGKLMVIPRAEIVLEDTWHTSGLRGTGSTHFHAEDLFVPEHRTIGFPFPEPQRGGALFRLPVLGFFGPAFSGFPQGVGRRALDEIVTLAKTKSRVGQETTVAQRPVFQRDLALAHGQLHATGLWVRDELQQLWTDLHDAVDASDLTTARRLASFAANSDAAIGATEVAFRYGGGDALFDSSPLQRSLRDMRVAAQHMLVSESNYEGLGKALTA